MGGAPSSFRGGDVQLLLAESQPWKFVNVYVHALLVVGVVYMYNSIVYIWLFPKMVVPNNHGFSYSKWSFWGVKWGYHHFRKPPYKYNYICINTLDTWVLHLTCVALEVPRLAALCERQIKVAVALQVLLSDVTQWFFYNHFRCGSFSLNL